MMIRLFAKRSMAGVPAIRSLEQVRFLSQTGRILEKATPSTPTESSTSQPAGDASGQQKKRILSYFDKRVLISTGHYKTIDEIPDNVGHETIGRARDKWRVKMCIYMTIISVGICIVQVIRGKKAAQRGESVTNANMEWHRQYNEAAAKKENK